jgi:outer membrane protein OmpA-like peptidoglycan-associated protein
MTRTRYLSVNRIAFFISGFLLLSISLAVSANDNSKCEPNPVFKRFAGEVMGSCERARFKELELWGRKEAPENPKSAVRPFNVEGEYWYYFNDIERDAKGRHPGKLEVQRNFENAVRSAKGVILNASSGKVVYRIKKGGDEFWGEAGCGRGGDDCSAVMHKIVRVAAMEQSVVVSAEQIAKTIMDEGKAVFYGLYFDTDKSVLKPESTPTLAEIAKWLKENPGTNVFIVGHTDMQGSVEHNLALSRSRAEAVVSALVKQHGIKPERLKAEGIASFAPVSNNTSESGRAKNRRVEMVLR